MERFGEPQRHGGASANAAAWVAGALLWVLLGLPVLLRSRDESATFGLGALVATLAVSLLLALALRWIYLRAASKRTPLWSPWIFVIAASIALLASLSAAAATDLARDTEEAKPSKEVLAEEALVDLPAGLRYAPSPTAERQRIERSFRAQLSDLPDSDVEVRRIVRDDGARGLLVALAAENAGDLSDFEKGFEETGGQVATERVGRGAILTGRDKAGNFVAFAGEGDSAVLVFAASARDARSFVVPFVPD